MLYGNSSLTGRAKEFNKAELVVTKTDLKGRITYANRVFYRLSDTTPQTALGKSQNIIRHPEMPRVIFDFLWREIMKGEEVFAYINNRSLGGDHYWVFAHVTPSYNLSGQLDGYHSNRRFPNMQVVQDKIEPMYRELIRVEKAANSPREGLRQSNAKLDEILLQNQLSFNELMFSFGL